MSDALQWKKLSKQNLEDLQDHISSLPQPDRVLLTPTMTSSDDVGPVAKRTRLTSTSTSIASSTGQKHNRLYNIFSAYRKLMAVP